MSKRQSIALGSRNRRWQKEQRLIDRADTATGVGATVGIGFFSFSFLTPQSPRRFKTKRVGRPGAQREGQNTRVATTALGGGGQPTLGALGALSGLTAAPISRCPLPPR